VLDQEIVFRARDHVDDGVADTEDIEAGRCGHGKSRRDLRKSGLWMSARTIAAAAERATQKANASPALFFDFRGAG
jgi:hypothetical protein